MADLYSILTPGQPRSYIADLNPGFSQSFSSMIDALPPELQGQITLYSGARSNERQAQLWENALRKYGSPEAARKWVAPPGKSQHNHGMAGDLRFNSDAARKWAHDNASRFGLSFPMGHEPWHIELASARNGTDPRERSLANAMTNPVLGADRRQAHILAADPNLATPPADPMPEQPAMANNQGQMPLGSMISGLMAGLAGTPSAPTVKQDDSGQVAMAANGLMERGRQLKSALMPDVASIMSLGKRPGVV